MAGLLGEVQEIFVDDARHTVIGAINQFDVAELARFEGDTGHRLIDNGGWSTALSD